MLNASFALLKRYQGRDMFRNLPNLLVMLYRIRWAW